MPTLPLPPNPAPALGLRVSGRSTEELSALVHQIYAAAANPQAWPAALGAVASSMLVSKGLLFTPYTPPQEGGIAFPWQLSEEFLQLMASKYMQHDLWAQAAAERNLWQEGRVVCDQELVPQAVLRASVIYRELLSAHQIGRLCAGVVFAGAPGLPPTAFSLFRDIDDPAFSPADVAWMQLLVPHLSRAMGLMHRLDAMRLRLDSLHMSLDRLDFGVALLCEQGQLLHANTALQRVLQRGDGIALDSQGRLQAQAAREPAATLSLWLEVQRQDLAASSQPVAHFSEDFLVQRSGSASGQTYAVQHSVLPARSGWAARGQDVRSVLFITDPSAVQLPDVARLTQLYALTPAQARVALELVRGGSYKQVAKTLGISDHTVSSHVKEIYLKTGLTRQADLVRNIMALGRVSV
jgi:DNA-binding CsgD family transcriptional regulator